MIIDYIVYLRGSICAHKNDRYACCHMRQCRACLNLSTSTNLEHLIKSDIFTVLIVETHINVDDTLSKPFGVYCTFVLSRNSFVCDNESDRTLIVQDTLLITRDHCLL